MLRRAALPLLTAAVLVGVALIAVGGTLSGDPRWTPDGLFYQARSLELRGVDREVALERTFQGPMGAQLRRIDPERSGDRDWVRYNAQFYERRIAVPLAARAIEPVAGERAVLDVSLLGYLAAVLAVFGLLLLRFPLPLAAGVALATIFLPALTHHASFPLTDSWGLALESAAFASGILAIERGPRWSLAWVTTILLLACTRDSVWMPLLGVAYLTLTSRFRSKVTMGLLGSGVAAALPVLIVFSAPPRELLAEMLNGGQPAADASWAFIAERLPGAVVDLLQANGGFVRDGAWYSAAYLSVGLLLLFALSRGARGGPGPSFLKAGAVAGVAYILAVPIFSALRLELVLVPMAAYGLGLGAESLAHRVSVRARPRDHLAEGLDSRAQPTLAP